MPELHSNMDDPENKISFREQRQPEAVIPRANDREKLSPQENDSARASRESIEASDSDPAHQKLEVNEGNKTLKSPEQEKYNKIEPHAEAGTNVIPINNAFVNETPKYSKLETNGFDNRMASGDLGSYEAGGDNGKLTHDGKKEGITAESDEPEKAKLKPAVSEQNVQASEKPEATGNMPKDTNEGVHEIPERSSDVTENRDEKPSNEGEDKGRGFFNRLSDFFHRERQPETGDEEVTENQKRGNWDGMETVSPSNGNGWTVLPGNHFDEYSDIYNNYGDHPRTSIPKEEQEFKTVNPADIEGVYLGETDIEDPSRFWNMHNGSKEDWMDTASHIPEVQSRLDGGETLQSLLDDDRLGRCAQAYFNPDSSKAIEVDEMPGGGYMFNGDGRHRIIAARNYGYDIPVKVIGRYD